MPTTILYTVEGYTANCVGREVKKLHYYHSASRKNSAVNIAVYLACFLIFVEYSKLVERKICFRHNTNVHYAQLHKNNSLLLCDTCDKCWSCQIFNFHIIHF